MRSLRRHAPDQRGRGSTADAIALVRALRVVVSHEAVEGPLQSRAVGEVAAPEGHPPELLENRTLQPFDETVRPGTARFSAGVPETELTTGGIKRPLELRATVGEHTAHRPARALEVRHDDLTQERSGRPRRREPAAGRPSRTRWPASHAVICQTSLDWRASMFSSVTTPWRGWADTELAIALISASLG